MKIRDIKSPYPRKTESRQAQPDDPFEVEIPDDDAEEFIVNLLHDSLLKISMALTMMNNRSSVVQVEIPNKDSVLASLREEVKRNKSVKEKQPHMKMIEFDHDDWEAPNVLQIVDGYQFKFGLDSLIKSIYLIAQNPAALAGSAHSDITFDVLNQIKRSTEFLQCLTDLIAVLFNPNPPICDFLINGNQDYLIDSIPSSGSIDLGYLSITSTAGVDFKTFIDMDVATYLDEIGYDLKKSDKVFILITTAEPILQDSFLEIMEYLESEDFGSNTPYVGFGCEDSLGNKIRISVFVLFE